MFERFLIWCDIHRRNKRVKLDISEALKRKEARSDPIGFVPRVRPLIVLEEDQVESPKWTSARGIVLPRPIGLGRYFG